MPSLYTLGNNVYAVGAGPGDPPLVKVYSASFGNQLASFQAYDSPFQGGVHATAADLNGDGVPDIITGPGPGMAPLVKIFDGRNLSLITSFFAYGQSFQGGVFVAAGDVNGDGRTDIITGAGPGGGPHVKVFNGLNLFQLNLAQTPDSALLGSFMAYDPSFTGGVSVAAGDVNLDGKADVITGAGPGGGPHVKVFSGASFVPGGSLTVLLSFMAYDPSFRGGVSVGAGDFLDTGRADVVTGAGPGGGPHVKVFNSATQLAVPQLPADSSLLGSFMAYDFHFTGGVSVASRDFNLDGRDDVITGPGPGTVGPLVRVFDGFNFNQIQQFDAFATTNQGGIFVH
jgi:hypothetical protein